MIDRKTIGFNLHNTSPIWNERFYAIRADKEKTDIEYDTEFYTFDLFYVQTFIGRVNIAKSTPTDKWMEIFRGTARSLYDLKDIKA